MAQSQARRAGIAAFVGTSIEWYDFFIYGFAAALVFGPLFFPDLSPVTALLASFATFGAAYVMRPLGAIVFGHIGDRLGRKKSLVMTLLMMGVATFAVGCLPTYDQIGIWAPVLLVTCRLVQGLSAGGEWGGAVLIASEHAKSRHFVSAGAWAQQGAPAGNLLSAMAFYLVSLLPDEQFLQFGWRLPFLVSAVLVVIGLIIRLGLEESPQFVDVKKAKVEVRIPLVQVLRTAPWVVVLGAITGALATTAGSFLQVFGLNWLTTDHQMSRETVLLALIVMSIAQFIVQPLSAPLAIRFKPLSVIKGSLLASAIAIPLGWLTMGVAEFWAVALGMTLVMLPAAVMYGILGGFLAEAFPPEVRYTGTGLAYQLGAMAFVAITPTLSVSLLAATGTIWSVIGFQGVFLIISFIASILLSRLTGAGLHATDDTPAAEATATALPANANN